MQRDVDVRVALFEEKTRDEALRFSQITDELEASKSELTAERAAADEMRSSVVSLRLQNAQLSTALKEAQDAVPEVTDDSETAEHSSLTAHSEALVAEATALRADAVAKLDDAMRDNEALQTRVDEGNELVAELRQREETLTASWTRGLADVREDAERSKAALEDRVAQQRRAIADAAAREAERRASVDDLRQENARIERDRERDVRQANELAERHRAAAEMSQERVVQMHKSMLEDLRQRDERLREMHAQYTAEQAQYQSKYTDAMCTLEVKTSENATLKRRVDALERAEEECKRLRTSTQEMTAERVRLEAEVVNLTRRVDTLAAEREQLRDANMRGDNELAMLRAEKKLNDARRAVMSTVADDE